jgi:hypothetical protein
LAAVGEAVAGFRDEAPAQVGVVERQLEDSERPVVANGRVRLQLAPVAQVLAADSDDDWIIPLEFRRPM